MDLRQHVAIVMRNSKEGRRCFAGSDREWNRLIDKLEGRGVYENDRGDLMLPALAHSLSVDIIIFNTSRRSVPFYPVSSTVWGGEKTSKPPLLLIYEAHVLNNFNWCFLIFLQPDLLAERADARVLVLHRLFYQVPAE